MTIGLLALQDDFDAHRKRNYLGSICCAPCQIVLMITLPGRTR